MASQILYVDDSPSMQRVMAITWLGQPVVVVAARTAQEAVARARAGVVGLAIVDAGLLAGDRGLVSDLKLAQPGLPVLLLGSTRHPVDAAVARAAGADAHHLKPFDIQALTAAAGALMGRPAAAAAPAARQAPAATGLPPPAPARRSPGPGLPPAAAAATALPADEMRALRAQARSIVEAVAWEVVPELAESMIATQLEARAKA